MNNKRDLSDLVMMEIKRRDISMRPKLYFTAVWWGQNIGAVSVLTVFMYFTSLLLFKLRFYDPFGYLLFGVNGLTAFIQSLPWNIIAYTSLIALLSVYLLKRLFENQTYRFAPVVLSVFMMIIGGFMVDKTWIHEYMRTQNEMPVFYKGYFYGENWVMGKVITVDNKHKKLTVLTPNEETYTLVWDDTTLLPNDKHFHKGDIIQAVGTERHEVLYTTGIKVSNIPHQTEKLFD